MRAHGKTPLRGRKPDAKLWPMDTTRTPPSLGPPVLKIAGDMGILIEFGDRYHPDINAAVIAFDRAFGAKPPVGVIETVPSFRSLLVRFDPLVLPFETLFKTLQGLLAAQNWYEIRDRPAPRRWVLPVVYGGARGPDLGAVADLMNLREDQVIDGHSALPLSVAMLGFSPGLAYLGQLPPIWQFPRRTEITPNVPGGAVLVAVRQTVLPATPIPTGWWQIGQTPFRGFDVTSATPFLLAPGDEVLFQPTSEAGFANFDMARLSPQTGA